MSKHVSRRAFLSTSAAAASVAAAPLAAAAPNPDADLLELGRQCTVARAEVEAAGAAVDDAAERFEAIRPKQPPQALFARPQDAWLDIPDPAPHPGGGLWYGRPDIIADLRKQPRTRQDWSNVREAVENGKTVFQCGFAPWPEAQARADEIVAACDRWTAETEAARHASGYAAATARLNEASKKDEALIRQFALYPATTLEGLNVKAHVAAAHSTDPESEPAFETMLEECGAETVMVMSIVRDLTRCAATAP